MNKQSCFQIVRPISIFKIGVFIVLLSFPSAFSLKAVNDLYWDSDGNTIGGSAGTTATGTWGTSAFWNTSSTGGAGVFTATTTNTNDVHFSAGADVTGAYTVTVSGAQTANSITFEDGSVTLSGGSITLGGGGGINSGITMQNLTGSNTVSTDLFLGSAATFVNNDDSIQNIFGNITGPAIAGTTNLTLAVNGNGALTVTTGVIADNSASNKLALVINGANTTNVFNLSGANTYSGGTTINQGLVNLGNANALGTGGLTVNGGFLQLLNGATHSVANLSGGPNGTIRISGVGSTATLAVGSDNTNTTYSGVLSEVGGATTMLTLHKVGTGTLILDHATGSSYHGPTLVDAGTLLANNTSGSATGTGPVTVSNNNTVLGGTGRIDGPVTVNAGAILQGGNGTVGTTLTLAHGLTLNDNSIIQLALGPGGTHSTLARSGFTWTFDIDQAFSFIDLGATTGTYDNLITSVLNPGSQGSWTITNAGWVGTFMWDGTGDGTGNIDLTLASVSGTPTPPPDGGGNGNGVPESGNTIALMAGAIGALIAFRLKRTRTAA